jgi:hypothetical protein
VDSWSVQLLTLLGVVVGVLSSFLSSRFIERTKWQRDQIVRWEARRLDCYSEFAGAIKRYINISHRIAAHLGLPATAQPLDQEEGLRSLADANEEILVKWEQMLLLGSPATIEAARDWQHAVKELEPLTRGLVDSDAKWLELEERGREARMHFYETARADLSITQPSAIST